jgi:hypothetical protein
MIFNSSELSPDQKAVLETLLERRVHDGEAVSVRTSATASVSAQRKAEIAIELGKYFAEVDATRAPASEADAEEILNEAMQSVRSGYRPRP